MSLREGLTRLRHMRDSAREAVALATGRKRHDLDTDRLLNLALTGCKKTARSVRARLQSCRTILKTNAGLQPLKHHGEFAIISAIRRKLWIAEPVDPRLRFDQLRRTLGNRRGRHAEPDCPVGSGLEGGRALTVEESKFDHNYVPDHLKQRVKNWRSLSTGERLVLTHEVSIAAWAEIGIVRDPNKPMDKTIRRCRRNSAGKLEPY